MNDRMTLLFAWLGGVAIGAIFFGGLWWTVRRGMTSPRPALWFLGSLLLRMGLALAGFYFVSGSHWERLLFCLLGFLVARFTVTWLTRSPEESQSSHSSGTKHAP
jgi:F1F0 ATPase subunit 2